MSDLLRAAVIGVGAMGQHHLRVFREIANVEMVGFADPNENLRKNISNRHNVRGYEDYHQLFEVERPHLVSVAVPTMFHHEVAIAAMRRGIHVLVEKPIAETVASAQAMIDSAKEYGVVLAIGHIERHNPAIRALKARLQAGELGTNFEITARRVGPFPPRIRDVGVIIDLATHDIDILHYLADSPIVRVFAETQQNIHSTNEDMVSGLIRFENNITGVLQINWLTPVKNRRLTVTGAGGMFEADYITQDLTFYENNDTTGDFQNLQILRGVSEGRVIRERIERREPLRLELEDFVDAVREKRSPLVTGEDSLYALRVAQALVESGKTHQVVHL